ncbi:VWA domain-containing protein [Simkania sp.]|uniref:VWA domain-containing protein n=1 Tax=Simkania sp. TaxID=34094 RepID=UPI003B51E895
MRKRPSSSQKRKPLLLTSLAASLTLHAGALYFLLSHPFSFLSASSSTKNDQTLVQAIEPTLEVEFALKETLDRLILREADNKVPSHDSPHLEFTKTELKILTNFAYAPNIATSTTPPPFHLEDPTYSINESEEYTHLKPSPFGPKKWINFSQRLEVEMVPLIAAGATQDEMDTSYVQPKLEQETEHAQIQDIGKLPMAVPQTQTEAPFAFQLEESPVSDMIGSEYEFEKHKPQKPEQIEKPLKVSPLAAKTYDPKKTFSIPFDPKAEPLTKQTFEREALYYFYDEKLKSSPSPKLEVDLTLKAPLFQTPFSSPKKLLEPHAQPSIAFFQSITPLDLSPLQEEHFLFDPIPLSEEAAQLTIPQTPHLSQVESAQSRLSGLEFSHVEVPPPTELAQREIKSPSIPLKKSIGQTFPEKLPDIPEEKLASLSQKHDFHPEKEQVQHLDPSEKSTFHRQQQLLTFQASFPFELTIDSATLTAPLLTPPKEPLTYTSSAVPIPQLGWSTHAAPEQMVATEVKPKREAVDRSSATYSNDALASQLQLPKSESAVAPALTSQPAFSPKYIAQSFDVPQAPLAFKSSDLSSIDLPEFAPSDDMRIAARQAEPKQEKVQPLEYDSSLALDLAGTESKEKRLYKPEDVEELPLSPSHTVRPKQKLSKHASALAIQKKPSMTEPSSLESQAHAKAVEAKEESIAFSFDNAPAKELANPSLPRFLMKRYPENRITFDVTPTPFSTTPHIAHAPPLADFQKAQPSVSPSVIEKQIALQIPDHELPLAQKTSPTPKPKQEQDVIAALPKRESIPLKISKPRSSKRPLLDLDAEDPVMKQDSLTLVKKEFQAEEPLAMPTLPYLKEKRVASSKVPFKPTKALTDLPSPETFISLVPRSEAFPNTKRILSKRPIPHREPQKDVQTSYTLTRNVKEVETEDIQSQAKELIEKHYNETLAQNGSVNVSKPELKKPLTEQDYHTINETHRFTQGYLSEIPETANLDTVSFQNDFETTVTYVKKPDGKGYHFALKIKPNEKLYFGSPEQNFIFVVDGSGTVQKHRYNTFKDAVVKSLSYMQEGDTFNILVADSQIAAMNDKPIIWSKQGIRKVRSYLQSRTYRGYFSNYDAFDLLKRASEYFDPNKENIVILITDGHSLETISKHKESLRTLAEKNKGHFSLFTACASQGNNIAMLDLISTFNNGEFMYSQTNAAFPRKLAVLVKHIESLIAKDIRIHVTSADSKLDVQFYPNQESYPSLYADQPYTLYGSIDKLEDFELILQGRAGDSWINIKQKVSFHNAKEAGYKLKRNFALQQAYVCYDYYLKQNDPFFLSEAERILSPHSVSPATR